MLYFCVMRWLKKIIDFYINSSIHVALAVYSLLRITELYFNLPYNEPLDYFVFYGTITGYNFVKYAGVAKFHHRSLTTNLKIIQIFSFFCFLLLCYYALKIELKTLLFLSPLALLTLLYAIPFLSGFQKNLRSISYLKVVVVAFVWASITVFLPIHDVGIEIIEAKPIYMFLQRFLLVTALILPFDIRDVKYDAISLQTIPKKIGVKNTKKLGVVLMISCLLLEFLITNTPSFRKVFFFVFMLFISLLMCATEKQSKYYSSFIVESVPIIWWCLLVFACF